MGELRLWGPGVESLGGGKGETLKPGSESASGSAACCCNQRARPLVNLWVLGGVYNERARLIVILSYEDRKEP